MFHSPTRPVPPLTILIYFVSASSLRAARPSSPQAFAVTPSPRPLRAPRLTRKSVSQRYTCLILQHTKKNRRPREHLFRASRTRLSVVARDNSFEALAGGCHGFGSCCFLRSYEPLFASSLARPQHVLFSVSAPLGSWFRHDPGPHVRLAAFPDNAMCVPIDGGR